MVSDSIVKSWIVILGEGRWEGARRLEEGNMHNVISRRIEKCRKYLTLNMIHVF